MKRVKSTTAYKKGNSGENRVLFVLNEFNDSDYNIHDIMLVDGKDTHQIDLISITDIGVFVIEVKNYIGYQIYGEQDDKYWYYNWRKNNKIVKYSFYNPIWQNRTHIEQVRKLIGNAFPIYSIVCFANDNQIVHQGTMLKSVLGLKDIKEYMTQFKTSLNQNDKEKIKNIILTNHHPEIKLEEHIKNVQKYTK